MLCICGLGNLQVKVVMFGGFMNCVFMLCLRIVLPTLLCVLLNLIYVLQIAILWHCFKLCSSLNLKLAKIKDLGQLPPNYL